MKAMIVGGEERYAFGITAKNLLTLGIEVKEHTASKGKYKPIVGTKGCDIIIVMADVCDHRAINGARDLAKEAQIPVVVTHRKWAMMKKDVGEVVQHIGIKAIQAANLQAQMDAKKARDDEQAALDEKGIQMARRAAEKANGDAQKAAMQHVVDATVLVLEERPELILGPQELLSRVQSLTDDVANQVFDVKKIVHDTARVVQGKWLKDGAKCAPRSKAFERLKAFHAIQDRWLLRWYKSNVKKNVGVPCSIEIQKTSKAIFGREITTRRISRFNRQWEIDMDVKLGDVWPKEQQVIQKKAAQFPRPPSKKPARKQVRDNSLILKTRRILTAYFEAAAAAGITNYSVMDRETGNRPGRAGKWARKLKRGTAEYLHDDSLSVILAATARWNNKAAQMKNEPIVNAPVRKLEKKVVQSDGWVVALVSGPTEKDIEMFGLVKQLRQFGVSIPKEIVDHFNGSVPEEEPTMNFTQLSVEFDSDGAFEFGIPEGVYAARIYKN